MKKRKLKNKISKKRNQKKKIKKRKEARRLKNIKSKRGNQKGGNQKGGKKFKKRKGGKSHTRATKNDNMSCQLNIAKVVTYQGIQMKNFMRQKKSIDRFHNLMSKKMEKKDNFNKTIEYLSSSCNSK